MDQLIKYEQGPNGPARVGGAVTKMVTLAKLKDMIADPSLALDGVDYMPTEIEGDYGFVSLDYANMDLQNKITTNNGTWTADRSGFVVCLSQTSVDASHKHGIAGAVVPVFQTNTVGWFESTFPVGSGQTVNIYVSSGFTGCGCYFIPPKINIITAPTVGQDYHTQTYSFTVTLAAGVTTTVNLESNFGNTKRLLGYGNGPNWFASTDTSLWSESIPFISAGSDMHQQVRLQNTNGTNNLSLVVKSGQDNTWTGQVTVLYSLK